MSTQTNSAPSWLFSFVDLAFLLLLAVTQLGSDERARVVDLGEIAVPRLNADATDELARSAPDRWQLRVHPPTDAVAPYELVHPDAAAQQPERIELARLETRLNELLGADAEQPLLAPHADSRAQDMLEAVGLLEMFWGKGRLATVRPEYAVR